MKRRPLLPAVLLTIASFACSLITARLDAQTKFGMSGGGTGGGSGTVQSASITVPAEITVTGSPITTSGTFALSWASALQNRIFAGPCGSSGTPIFRGLCSADIPNNAASTSGNAATATALATNPTDCSTHQFAQSIVALGNLGCAQPAIADLSDGSSIVLTGDSRLTNARTPTAHASTHAAAGSDPVTLTEAQVTSLVSDLAGKQATGSYITSVTGDATATGPGAAPLTLASIVSASTKTKITYNAKGQVTAGADLASGDLPSHTHAEADVTGLVSDLAGKQATGNYITATTGDVVATGPGSVTATIQADSVALGTDTTGGYAASSTEAGPATTATALAANGTNCSAPNFARGVDASGACEGAAIVASDLPSTAVTPGSYTLASITVDAQGRLTSASSGSAGGVTSLNALTGALSVAAGTSGTDFAVSPSGSTITLNLPDASATARGVVTTGAQTVAGVKTFTSSPTAPGVGARSERFGASAVLHTSATDDTVIGASSTVSAGAGTNTVLGSSNTVSGSSNQSIIIGKGGTVNSGGQGILIGNGNTVSAGYSMIIGSGSDNLAEANVAQIGSGGFPINFLQIMQLADSWARTSFYGLRAAGAKISGGSSNQGGTSLTLNGGPSSGTGKGGDVLVRTTPLAASSSTRTTYADREITVAAANTLTELSATGVADITIASGSVTGGTIFYTIESNDGTDFQAIRGRVAFVAENKAGTVTSTAGTADETSLLTAGTLTNTFSITNGTGKITLNFNALSSLVQTVLRVSWHVLVDGGTGAVTPL
jgi:hypothetical protein